MVPAVKPLLSVAQLADNANEASRNWHTQFIENFVESFRGQRVMVPHPNREGAVEAEIQDAYWALEEGCQVVVEYWCDKREEYVLYATSG
jgi:hypothetical protein